MEGYYIVLPKLINNNTLLGVFNKHHGLNYFGLDYQRGIAHGKEHSMHMRYSVIKHHGLNYFEGYCSCSKLQNTFAIPFIGFPINTLGSITYIFKLEGVMHSLTNMG
jgi:hypothetical protein